MIVEKEKSGHPIVQQEQPSVLIQVVDIKAQFQFSRATLRIISTNDSWTKNPSFVALVLVSTYSTTATSTDNVSHGTVIDSIKLALVGVYDNIVLVGG